MILEASIFIAVITGLVEVGKRLGLQDRWLPLLAVILGVGINFLGNIFGDGIQIILGGVIAGLSAVGLWEISKHTLLGR